MRRDFCATTAQSSFLRLGRDGYSERTCEPINPGQPQPISRAKRIAVGALSGALAGIVMTTVMLLLASLFGIVTPLTLLGDRLSVLFNVETFLALMGRVGGYNRMKQLGVSSVMIGQILFGAGGGIAYALMADRFTSMPRRLFSSGIFIVLPLAAVALALWPVLGTHNFGLPIRNATIVTLPRIVCGVRRVRAHARRLHLWFNRPLALNSGDAGMDAADRSPRIDPRRAWTSRRRRRRGVTAEALQRRDLQLRWPAVSRAGHPGHHA
jgi:hypothetical protein